MVFIPFGGKWAACPRPQRITMGYHPCRHSTASISNGTFRLRECREEYGPFPLAEVWTTRPAFPMEGRTTHNALLISSLFRLLTKSKTRSTTVFCWNTDGGFLRTLARTVVLTSTTPARSGPFPLPREIVLYSLHPRVQGIKDLLHAGLENPRR